MMKKILFYLFLVIVFFSQSYSQIEWEKNPNNPVLKRGSSGEWDDLSIGSPTIIYNGTMYQMWYNGNDGSNANIGYATSTDKINWDKHPTPVLEHGPNGSWDDLYILHPSVYFDGTTYHMWYTGVNGSFGQIGYATSSDSMNWTKYSDNPVLTLGEPGSWDDQSVNTPDVSFIDGVFHMWYTGFDGSHEQIGHATSLNGMDWQKDTLNPVLKVGGAGSWDNANVSQPSVLFDGTIFHMFYGGGPDFAWRIGYAYSEDGVIWHRTEMNNPVLEPGLGGNWESKYVGYQDVCFNSDSTGFDMWYNGAAVSGYIGDIGFATAPKASFDFDIKPLIKYPENQVLLKGSGGEWNSVLIENPYVLFDGTVYHMWYAGSDGNAGLKIGYAHSLDAINWTKYDDATTTASPYAESDPVLSTGPSGSWDGSHVLQPSVIFDGTTYHMWYGGTSDDFLTNRHIGYATSQDKINWTKYNGNFVLPTGPPGSWDDVWVDSPNVLFINGVYHMWYCGSDGTHVQTGHATSFDGITWDKDTLNPVLRVGAPGSWDSFWTYQPSVLFDGIGYHMFYSGSSASAFSAFQWRIGYAYSFDGNNWIKYNDPTTTTTLYAESDPVLNTGSSGSWDDTYVGQSSVIFNIDSSGSVIGFKMWYGGGNGIGTGDIGFASTDTLDFIIDDVENSLNVIPNEFTLSQNYPNPFNPTTKIRYQVPTTSLVSIRIYNLIGEVIATLVSEEKSVGTYELNWNAENLSSGVYFYRLQAGNFIETKKMLLLK